MSWLRALVVALAVLALVGGGTLLARMPRAWPVGIDLIVFGLLVLVTMRFEGRYRNAARGPHVGFEPTGERFLDPVSGASVEVEYNPATGERLYRNG